MAPLTFQRGRRLRWARLHTRGTLVVGLYHGLVELGPHTFFSQCRRFQRIIMRTRVLEDLLVYRCRLGAKWKGKLVQGTRVAPHCLPKRNLLLTVTEVLFERNLLKIIPFLLREERRLILANGTRSCSDHKRILPCCHGLGVYIEGCDAMSQSQVWKLLG
jgi:hypothetical protein